MSKFKLFIGNWKLESEVLFHKSGNYLKLNSPGQLLIVIAIFMLVMTILTTSLFTQISNFVRANSNSIYREQATTLAEAGIDYATFKLNDTAGAYCNAGGVCDSNIAVGTSGVFTVTLENKASYLKTITSTGYVPDAVAPLAKRTIKLDVMLGENVSFRYAAQIGDGGLTMDNSAAVNGTVYSNGPISGSGNSTIIGDAYSGGSISSPDPTVTGTKYQNQPPIPLPDIADLVTDRKQAAEAGGIVDCAVTPSECTISNSKNIGPKKYINGNLLISNNALVVMQGAIWVTGNLIMTQGNTTLKLDNSYASLGEVFLVDGIIDLNQGGNFQPTSASPPGYILMVTPNIAGNAVVITQGSATALFYAENGGAIISQTAHVVSLVSRSLSMTQSSQLTYEVGLASAQFAIGPGGSWEIRRGTYRFTASP